MSALTAESWTWFALCLFIVGCRLVSRILLLGSPRQLQADDGLILIAMGTYTALIVCVNTAARSSSNLINPADGPIQFTPDVVEQRSFGSKMVLVSEQMQLITIWLIKGCLLIMYGRLTTSTKQSLAVKLVAAYVVIGFIVMEILYLGVWCRPFNQYWAVPTSNSTNHLITNAILNISSDIFIMAIPMPIFLAARLPLKRKIILCGVFGLGTFSILSAILNKFYSFTEPFGSAWVFWYVRESSTAILTANIPFTWTLLQRTFNIGSFAGSSRGRSRTTYHQFNHSHSTKNATISRKAHRPDDLEGNDSQEQIVPLEIWQNVQLSVQTSAAVDDKKPNATVTETGAESINDAKSDTSNGSKSDDIGLPNAGAARVTTTCVRGPD
ncbi:putative family decarboxylase [Diplodia seriata]|uniref:Putative family decarboxylase n=1 Tax=Diplodia seriata TaxID=420778 RepID=A0A0G2FYB4_9PEZI|nr:putative family decarboxylase [Diplodia seriata]